ncbi:MAG TPA: hypothetical protein VE081_08440 [Sporichthyaceae bacterium]|nr:hypothetical protein [Sporichthyaceae bacterium]
MTRTSATKLRWTVTACLVAASAAAGVLVVMSHHPSYTVAPTTAIRAELR